MTFIQTVQLKVLLTVLLGTIAFGNEDSALIRAGDAELVGNWELVAIIENGVDVTGELGVTGNGELVVYMFEMDGTFSITAGSQWFESGTWKSRSDTTPKQFDHTPTEAPGDPDIVGIESLGIYEAGGEVVKFCVADEPPDIRPQMLDSNSCLIFIVRRISD